MDLSIIIVSYNTKNYLKNCLNSLFEVLKESKITFEIFIVDNNSTDGSQEMIKKEFPPIRLIENRENAGFAKANNQAMRIAKGCYVLLLNPDTIVIPKSLDLMLEFMKKEQKTGILAPKLIGLDGIAQRSVGGLSTPLVIFWRFCLPRILSTKVRNLIAKTGFKEFLGNKINSFIAPLETNSPTEVDFASGACLLVRRATIKEIGLLDEKFFMYAEDADWCLRIKKASWKIIYFPKVKIIHDSGKGGSGGAFSPLSLCRVIESNYYYFKKNYSKITSSIVGFLLLFALITRAPWFLYHHFLLRKKDKSSNLWGKYQSVLIRIIAAKI